MSRRRRRSAQFLAPALAALALAACGSASPPTQQLRLSVTQACAAANAQAQRIATPTGPAGGVTFLQRGVAVFTPELRQLRGLRAPSELASTYSTAMNAFARKLSALNAAITGINKGADPLDTLRTLQRRLSPIESREDAAWHALGVPACLNR